VDRLEGEEAAPRGDEGVLLGGQQAAEFLLRQPAPAGRARRAPPREAVTARAIARSAALAI
jgi:hypothetical protein